MTLREEGAPSRAPSGAHPPPFHGRGKLISQDCIYVISHTLTCANPSPISWEREAIFAGLHLCHIAQTNVRESLSHEVGEGGLRSKPGEGLVNSNVNKLRGAPDRAASGDVARGPSPRSGLRSARVSHQRLHSILNRRMRREQIGKSRPWIVETHLHHAGCGAFNLALAAYLAQR